jgi:hypothetical protein
MPNEQRPPRHRQPGGRLQRNACQNWVKEVEIGATLMQYAPYSSLKVHPVGSVTQAADVFKRMSG